MDIEYEMSSITRWVQNINKYDVCSEQYLSLLDMDIEGVVRDFNEFGAGYEKMLFDEKIEHFISNCVSPSMWVSVIIDAKKLKRYEKAINQLASKNCSTGEELFYSFYALDQVSYADVRKALDKVENILKGDEIKKLWRFSSRYHDLAEQMKERREVFRNLYSHSEKCKKLNSLIYNGGDEELEIGFIRFEGNKGTTTRAGTRKEMAISELIRKPFEKSINQVCKNSLCDIPKKTFSSIDDLKNPSKIENEYQEINNNSKLEIVYQETDLRKLLKMADNVDELGYILAGDYATIGTARTFLDRGINPVNAGFKPMKLTVGKENRMKWIINTARSFYWEHESPSLALGTCLRFLIK